MDAGNWTWLEVAKLIVAALTPIAIALAGIYIHRVTKNFEHIQWRSQKLIEKRLTIYDSMATFERHFMLFYLRWRLA
jgi:hypothetical protein